MGEGSVHGGLKQFEQVGFQKAEEHLGLGVAEPAVEFEHSGPAGRKHEAGEEHSSVAYAVGLKPRDEAVEDLGAHGLLELRGEHGGGAEGAHAAGVQTCIVIECPLVVLGSGEEEVILSVHKRVNGTLRTGEALLNDDGVARCAEFFFVHDFADGAIGLLACLGDNDAFSEGEAVGFDDDGERHGLGEASGLGAIGEITGACCGDAVAEHEFLGENL